MLARPQPLHCEYFGINIKRVSTWTRTDSFACILNPAHLDETILPFADLALCDIACVAIVVLMVSVMMLTLGGPSGSGDDDVRRFASVRGAVVIGDHRDRRPDQHQQS